MCIYPLKWIQRYTLYEIGPIPFDRSLGTNFNFDHEHDDKIWVVQLEGNKIPFSIMYHEMIHVIRNFYSNISKIAYYRLCYHSLYLK